jgi:hypothetical protein
MGSTGTRGAGAAYETTQTHQFGGQYEGCAETCD